MAIEKEINDFTDGSGELVATTNVACQQSAGGTGSTQKIQFAEFQNKTIDAITQGFSGGKALQSNTTTKIVEESAVTNTELSYVSGVTSAIQTQLNQKQIGLNILSVGVTPNVAGMSLVGPNFNLEAASELFPGVVTTGTQSFAGNKTFTGEIASLNLTGFNRGDLVTDVVNTAAPNSTGMFMTAGSFSDPQKLQLCAATATTPGVITETTQTIGGAKTLTGTIVASNLSGTNHGDFTTGDVFNAPNSTGIFMTVGSSSTPQKLQLTPADVTNPGILIPDGVQFLGGSKVIAGLVSATNLSVASNFGDLTVSPVDSGPPSPTGINAINGNSTTPQSISLCSANSNFPGLLNATSQEIGGEKDFQDITKLSYLNSGERILLSNNNKQIIESTATALEASYLSGVSAPIQNQIDSINNNAIGAGYVLITSAVNVDLLNPCYTNIEVNFTLNNLILRLPDMSEANALQASKGASIRIKNIGSQFTIVNKHSNDFWNLKTNQIIELLVKSNATPSGLFLASYSMTQPVNNQVYFGSSDQFGNPYFNSSPNMTFDGNNFSLNSTTGTFKVPRMTTAQRLALSSVEGDEVYDLTLHQKMLYNGSAWVILG